MKYADEYLHAASYHAITATCAQVFASEHVNVAPACLLDMHAEGYKCMLRSCHGIQIHQHETLILHDNHSDQ